MRRNSQGDPDNRRRQLHGLILRSDAQRRVSKDGPARSLVSAPWSVLETPRSARLLRTRAAGSYDETPILA